MICGANQLTGFYMIATLVFNELRKRTRHFTLFAIASFLITLSKTDFCEDIDARSFSEIKVQLKKSHSN